MDRKRENKQGWSAVTTLRSCIFIFIFCNFISIVHTLPWQSIIKLKINYWGTQSPTYPISWTKLDVWLVLFCIMLPQNKIRRNHEGCFFMKKTGSMPCTGTETTTITNAMLNTLKLRRVIGLKLRPNILVQHIATLPATEKSPAEVWSKWNSSTPPYLLSLFLICIICPNFSLSAILRT